MNNVPVGLRLLVSALAGVVITEAIKASVPQWSVPLDEGGFDGANHVGGNVFADHESAPKVCEPKIAYSFDAPSVLINATPQFARLAFYRVRNTRLPPSLRYGFSDVDWEAVGETVEVAVLSIKRV